MTAATLAPPAAASHRSAYLLLVLAALFWSGNFVLARAMHAAIPPFTLAFARWGIALLVLLPLGLKPMLAERALWRPHWRRIVVLALLGITGFNSLVYVGLHSTSATNGVLLNSFIPILIVALGALGFGLTVGVRQALAIAVSFVGVVTIVAHGEPARLLALQLNPGDALVFAAMVCWALYTLLLRAVPPAIDRVDLLTLLVALGLIALSPFCAWEWSRGATVRLDAATLSTFAYMGTLPSVAAYYFYNFGVARVGAARAGTFIHLMPAFGALLSTLWLGEAIAAYHLAGIGLILAGVALATRAARR
ncbi:threonine/homoserine efflux transporter RhtA [Crenobacter luteus]|uniref:DMT family transporter n=1 Tax=Crenobacter luteus TaxID=1452487 RepID=UPI00104BE6AF|nr:DMT family transporter [Crenobacter luteus]TCP10903.1 threonine/homoserine efflux transporter RhtA [Crenobacter luteus]